MTAKELLLKEAPRWSEEQAERALLAAEDQSGSVVIEDKRLAEQHRREIEEWGEPETVGLPESWKTFDDGTPQPDWLATLDEVRRGR
jgi:hypothetical protein